jgi:rhamnogalacturonyl hydrolase YesR
MNQLRVLITASLSAVFMVAGCEQASRPTTMPAAPASYLQPLQAVLPTTDPTTQAYDPKSEFPVVAVPRNMETLPPAKLVARITETLVRVRNRLDSRLIMHIKDPKTGTFVPFPAPPPSSALAPEAPFSPVGYPAAVAYAGMLSAADATGDKAFDDFVARRFQFFADALPEFSAAHGRSSGNPFAGFIHPSSLDSCGAMGAAFVKARVAGVGPDLKPLIDRFAEYVSHRQYRLDDGTLARHRPFKSSLWLDDAYMSVPLLAQMGSLTRQPRYFDDGARQIIQFSDRLFRPSLGLYTHACDLEDVDDQPNYFWGRANGWAIMAMSELLDVLPQDHPQRAAILKIFRMHARGLASLQAGNGMWHQLLDRNDSYLETSCSAMFTYSIARGVNRGWLTPEIYGPVAIAGWSGIQTKIDPLGRITGTCVGTSYAADASYYYNRPAGDDIHGYGPTLLAGSEVIRMLENPEFRFYFSRNAPFIVRRASQTPATESDPQAGDPDSTTQSSIRATTGPAPVQPQGSREN